jgi:hypothetical protein
MALFVNFVDISINSFTSFNACQVQIPSRKELEGKRHTEGTLVRKIQSIRKQPLVKIDMFHVEPTSFFLCGRKNIIIDVE